MKKRFLPLLVFISILGLGIVQSQTTDNLLNLGGLPIAFTSDAQFLVAPRYEVPANISVETPTTLFIDVYRWSPFELVESYALGALNPDRPESIEFIAISHDTRFIAYVQLGGLNIFDRTTGQTSTPGYSFMEFEALEFNPINNLLAYVMGRGITVLDATDPTIKYELFDDVYGNGGNLAWSPDGRYLATGVFRRGENHDVVVWDMTLLQPGINREAAFVLPGGEPVQVSWRDNDTLASFGTGGVSIFDIPSRSLIVFIRNPSGMYWSEGDWSPDGTQLLASGGNQTTSEPAIQIWDVSNLPAYESIFYQEGVIASNIHWLQSGLFTRSRGGIRLDGELLSVQLTATAQFTPQPTPTYTPTFTPTPTATATFTPTESVTCNTTVASGNNAGIP